MSRPLRFVLPVIALALSACATGTFRAGAAIVNGQKISTETLDARVSQAGGADPQQQQQSAEERLETARRVLVQLIQSAVIGQEADRRGLGATEAEITEQLDGFKSRFPTEQAFLDRLRELGFTVESAREVFRESIVSQKLADDVGGVVTDAEVRAAYDAQRDQFREVRTKHILALIDQQNTEAQATARIRRAQAALDDGDSFAAVAKRFSQDPSSADRGGALDFIPLGRLDPVFADAAWKARIGRLVGPIRSQFGIHLIIVEEKRTQSFAQVSAQIRAQLEQDRRQAGLSSFLQERLRTARIVVNPRYGDWDPETGSIVPHRGFVPATPDTQPGISIPGPFPPDGG